ncbi:hypothetical protein B6I21_00550 [candidate division KSB1 bacterium 4572_119]|nr:MAG: hypothetical protein B6I21_00550 [candidate division KSB1 bacterium 4572_119]
MYEPYPYNISRNRIIFLVLLFLSLLAIFFGVKYQYLNFSLTQSQNHILENCQLFLLILLIVLSLKTFKLQFAKEYYLLTLGFAAFLLFQIMRQHFFDAGSDAATVFKAKLYFDLLSWLPLNICLLFAVLVIGKTLPSLHRFRFIFIVFVIAVIFNFSIYFLLKQLLTLNPVIEKYHLEIPDLLIILNLVLFLFALVKFFQLYFVSRHKIYFYYLTALLFFIISNIFLLPTVTANDIWQNSSLLLSLMGFIFFLFIYFTENTKFLETEFELRTALESELEQNQESLKEYRSLIKGISASICVFNKNGKVTFFNDRFAELLGRSEKYLADKKDSELFDDKNFDKFQVELEKLKSGGEGQFEIEIKSRSGKNIPVMISATSIFDKVKRYQGCRIVIFEMAERREKERRLKDYSANLEQLVKEKSSDLQLKKEQMEQATKYYESLISGMLDILLVVDRRGNCTYINQYGRKLLGYEAKQLTSKKLPNFFADMEQLQKSYGDAVNVELRDYEAKVKPKSGKAILCSWNVRYLFDPDGNNIGAMCVGRDISEYKAMREKLEEYSRDLEKQVARRTNELKTKINQLSKILKIGEDIAMNLEIGKIISNICGAIKSMGWQVVIFTLKEEESNEFKIAAYAGLNQSQLRSFVSKRNFIYKDVFKFAQDEFKISYSYMVKKHLSGNAKRLPNEAENNTWQPGDVLMIPVKYKKKILGFINVFNPVSKNYPEKQQVQVLETFAHKAAVCIENRRLFDETQIRAKELTKANRVKTNFFTTMSHELRTPLNSITSLTDVLIKQMSGELNPEQLKQVKIISQNGKDLLKLINDLLDLSRIDAGKMDVSYNYFSIRELIQTSIDKMRPLCDRKNLKLELRVDRNFPKYVFSDSDKIRQVLTNLLGNAVKFTQKGKIKVSAKFDQRASSIQLSVADSGIGMSENEADQIFKKFSRTENVSRKKIEGSGLGLSISYQLLQLMGGSIHVESKKGKGSTFHVTIPVKKITTERQAPTTAEKIDKTVPPTRQGNKKKSRRQQKTILVIDDNRDNQYAAKFILEEQGHRAIFAGDGAEGIQQAKKEKPDLILMDLMMPGIDGYQATRKIRNINQFKKVPIIAMTAKTPREDKKKAIKAGCNDYLNKPFTLDDILEKIEKWLG